MNWYKKATLEDIPDIFQKMFGLGKYEIILYCDDCGEVG